ncbi:MAG: GNAT family N-acetyltransferase [Anaerolineales bacterium]|nr:GNAT family N-acetyltransferase [Anaerolineales bacterium]
MKIREFLFEQDFEEVRELWISSGPGIQLSPSDSPAEIQKKLQRDPDLFLVAERDGRIIGTVFGGFDGRRGLVYHLAVLPGERRSGIGRSLMVELEHRLRLKGCRKYYLLVTKDNEDGLHFYESYGAEVMDLYVLGKVIQ